jgi:hypothetical protein
MVGAMLVVLGTVIGYWINVTNQRLEPGKTVRTPTQEAAANAPATAIAPANSVAGDTAPVAPVPPPTPAEATPPPAENGIEVRRAEPVAQQPFAPVPGTPAAGAVTPQTTAVVASPTGVNEVVVEPLKKTWVKIRKDSPTSLPIFEDYLYPGDRPLVLRGAKFFVEVRDQDAVQIRKNGSPIAYQAPGISIQ